MISELRKSSISSAGPSVGILTSSRLEAEFSGIVFEADLMDNTEKIDFGLTFGGGFSFPIEFFTIFLEGRYTMGMTDLQKGGTFEATAGHLTIQGSLEEDDKYKTLGLQILIRDYSTIISVHFIIL